MTNMDTVNLLQETNKGVQMALYSFDQLLETIRDPAFKKLIVQSKADHTRLLDESKDLMKANHILEEEPGAMAKSMAWMETNVKTMIEDSDRTAADIITNGCNMGAKKLRKYINEYAGADETAADTAKKLIKLEEDLAKSLHLYL